jgi:NAD-dependent dihydropyrimidine dehydrogenase PreA subunit
MKKSSPVKTILLFLITIALVVGLSFVSGRIWGGKPEALPENNEWIIDAEMTLKNFGQANNLPNPVLKGIFNLTAESDLQKKLSQYGTSDQIRSTVKKKLALAAEHATKNWVKILIKFGFWFAFLLMIFFVFRNRKMTRNLRKWLLFGSVMLFGVILGSDPSPMGTVKDAIYLYGSSGAIFPPRLIALLIFLLTVFVANKFICAWGCQLGVLQDLIFRFNQANSGKSVLGKQFKLPFVITNSIRVIFLAVFTFFAFVWGFDIIGPIDPFKIFTPAHLGIAGAVFAGTLLIMSLFVYRPWCHLFCPFGLVGWVVEKISLFRINVDYETCIGCQKCADACPSMVMSAILGQDKKTIPDCFACYTCMQVCPTNSIQFSTDKRIFPPVGQFDKKAQLKTTG